MEVGISKIETAAKKNPFSSGPVYVLPEEMEAYHIVEGENFGQEELCSLLNAKRGGSELVRVRDLLKGYQERKQGEENLSDALSPTEEEVSEEESEEESPTSSETDTSINRQVLGQLLDMPVPNGSTSPMKRLFIQNGNLVWGNAEPADTGDDTSYKPAQDFSKALGQSPADVSCYAAKLNILALPLFLILRSHLIMRSP